MKLVRPRSLAVPEGVCLRCFNQQQRLTFPFFVYCVHRESLAFVQSQHDSTTYACDPSQVPAIVAKLSNGAAADALSPARD